MSRYTESYSSFVKRLSEVDRLQWLANEQISPRRNLSIARFRSAPVANDLCRSGVVLLSSHIEGYVKDLAELILQKIREKNTPKSTFAPCFLYYFSRDIIDQIRDTRDPERTSTKVMKLFQRDSDIWCDNNFFSDDLPVDRFVRGFSVPNFKNIKKFIGRFGYTNYDSDLRDLLNTNYNTCTNMVNNVVDQRNKIAHGDFAVTITPADLVEMTKYVKKFCRATDMIVGNWFISVGCPIRYK